MTGPPHDPVRHLRRARIAASAQFLTNGALFANLAPRLPDVKADLALSNAAYGMVVAAFPAGALVAGMTAGALVRRYGDARTALAGTIGIALTIAVAAASPSALLVAAALFLGGAADAVTDVAQNTHGLRVQRAVGRSIINSLHAVWSIGAVLGSAMGAAALALHVPRAAHLAATGILFTGVAVLAYRARLPGADAPAPPTAHGPTRRVTLGRPYALLALLMVITIAGAVVEDLGSSWSTLYFGERLGVTGALAASGYVGLLASQFVGRLLGDRLVDRFGERRVVRSGGILAAAGVGLALAFPSVPSTLVGFAAAGFGLASAIPAAMHAADRLPGLPQGRALTTVAWSMRIGFVGAPAVVGALADATTLRVGLLVVPVAALLAVACAGALSARPHPPTR